MAVTQWVGFGVNAELHTIQRKHAERTGIRDYDDPDVPFTAKTAYAVVVDGERIGVVSSKRGTTHRKAGRLIVSTSHPTEWVATLTNFYSPREGLGRGEWRPVTDVPEGRYVTVEDRAAGDWHQGRRDAVERLVRLWQELTEDE